MTQTLRSALSKHKGLKRLPTPGRTSPRIPSPTFRQSSGSLDGPSRSERLPASSATLQRNAKKTFRGGDSEASPRHFRQLNRTSTSELRVPQPVMAVGQKSGTAEFQSAQLYESSLIQQKRALLDEHYKLQRRVEEKERVARKRAARAQRLAKAMELTGRETKEQRRTAAKYAHFVKGAYKTSYDEEFLRPDPSFPDTKFGRAAFGSSCTAFAAATASSPQLGRGKSKMRASSGVARR